MPAGFRRASDGTVHARFQPFEAALLRRCVADVADLLGGEQPGGDPLEQLTGMAGAGLAGAGLAGAPAPSRPDDPALARLLPDAYADDDAAAGEWRRLVEPGLRAGKVAATRAVLETLPEEGGRVTLDEATAESWLAAVNDVRLVLGTRLDVTEDTDLPDDPDPDDAYEQALAVYAWLGWLLETLVEALAGDAP